MKLDYTIESPEERKALVEKILEENENITPAYLEILADYLVLCMEKQEKKTKKILTENRMATVTKRETSFEGLVGQLENGEDGIYNLIAEDKNVIFQPKISITKKDLETIPYLRQLRDSIDAWDILLKKTSGKDAYTIKKALIEMRKDQYIIKQAYRKPIIFNKLTRNNNYSIKLEDESYMDENGEVYIKGFSLMDPKVITNILCNYSKLRQDNYDKFNGDIWYVLYEFERLSELSLKEEFPLYYKLIIYKIDGKSNQEIQSLLKKEFGTTHSLEYLSSLWRNKIPKLIAQIAKEDFITCEYKRKGLYFKKCSRCGQVKPGHNDFFSRNKTSKDSYYSICKKCRNKNRRK